ncbi:MAG: hypothetical protein ACRELB_16090, partial [Polyangiaceae bacterium]
MRRRPVLAVWLAPLALACNSGGNAGAGAAADAGADATTDAPPGSDDGPSTGDDAAGYDAEPCLDFDAALPVASADCVYAGDCPASCSSGTASAYACNEGPDGAATFPSVFAPPADVVDILAFVPGAYPWGGDAGAYLSCAALTCTRWATADHVDGGSAWGADPCADAGTDAGPDPLAWACPLSPGVIPPVAGCTSAGDLNAIGGGDSGIPENAVWCCPRP